MGGGAPIYSNDWCNGVGEGGTTKMPFLESFLGEGMRTAVSLPHEGINPPYPAS